VYSRTSDLPPKASRSRLINPASREMPSKERLGDAPAPPHHKGRAPLAYTPRAWKPSERSGILRSPSDPRTDKSFAKLRVERSILSFSLVLQSDTLRSMLMKQMIEVLGMRVKLIALPNLDEIHSSDNFSQRDTIEIQAFFLFNNKLFRD